MLTEVFESPLCWDLEQGGRLELESVVFASLVRLGLYSSSIKPELFDSEIRRNVYV